MPAYKDDKTGKWFAKFRTKDWKGETKHVTKRGFDTRREALAYEREYLVTQHGAPDMTFAEYATLYKKDIAPRIKESTFETKKSIIDKRLIPYFGNKKLSSINSTDVLNWQNELINCNGTRDGTPFTKSYLKTIHNQLSAMLNHAVKYYGLPNNYARLVGNMGHEKDVKTDFWTLEEYECFSKSIIDFPEAFYAFEILYWCGIREGKYKGGKHKEVSNFPEHYARYMSKSITKSALARELGISRPTLDRMIQEFEQSKE